MTGMKPGGVGGGRWVLSALKMHEGGLELGFSLERTAYLFIYFPLPKAIWTLQSAKGGGGGGVTFFLLHKY